MKNKKISIIGIGKLGLCFALVLEKNGYNVLGIDISEDYINTINNKTLKSPEPDVENFLLKSKNFTATTNIEHSLEHSDILFLFVATPSLPNGRYDHSQIEKVVDQLAKYTRSNQKKHLIIGCTTMPGFCDKIQNRLKLYGYSVSYNPAFIAQGSIIRDLVRPDILLIGAGHPSVSYEIEEIYSKIPQNTPTIHHMNQKEAEITKIALNCFLTTKIAYANMVGDIAKSASCNPEVILSAIGSDSRIGNKNLKYGYGFGGPCFPRDNRAFFKFASDVKVDAVISKASDVANQSHLTYQIEEYKKKYDKSEVLVFSGLAYKKGTTMIEESQKLVLAVELARVGYSVFLDDSHAVLTKIKLIYGDLFSYKE